MVAKRRQRLPKEERREQLLAAAARAFGRNGYHATQVETIIQEAGVARGTFYLHFESKHEIFATLIDRMLEILLEVAPEGTPADFASLQAWEDFLRRSYSTVFQTLRRYRQLGHLLFSEAIGLDKGFADKLERYYGAWRSRISDTLKVLQKQRIAPRDLDPEVTAELVLGMVERAARRFVFRTRTPDLDRIVDTLVRLEMGALRQ